MRMPPRRTRPEPPNRVLAAGRVQPIQVPPREVERHDTRSDLLDPGDADAVAAALREAREETGLDPAGVEVLGALEEVPLAYSQHVVTPVLAWWTQPSPVHVVDVAESADVFRAPVADLLNPANRGSTVIRRGGVEYRGPGFLLPGEHGEHLVWGFTGLLLDGLFDRLGWTEEWDPDRVLPLALPEDEPDADVPGARTGTR